MLQIWYPISNESATTPALYLPNGASAVTEKSFGFPRGTTAAMKTQTFANGTAIHPLLSSDSKLPVLVFSPGSGIDCTLYSIFISPLASYGYYVVGVDHTFDSAPIEFPNGEVTIGVVGDRNATLNAISANIRHDDVMFVAKQLTLPILSSWLPGLSKSVAPKPYGVRLGIYGQSIGGATAALALQNDSSPYISGFSFDGPFYGDILTEGFHGPFFYIASNESPTHDDLVKQWPKIRGWKNAILLNGTTHYDYSDLLVLVPQVQGTAMANSYKGKLGTIDPTRMVGVTTTYLKAFWDWTLLNHKEEPFLSKTTKEYPEVLFDVV
jgi:hypothetical protein